MGQGWALEEPHGSQRGCEESGCGAAGRGHTATGLSAKVGSWVASHMRWGEGHGRFATGRAVICLLLPRAVLAPVRGCFEEGQREMEEPTGKLPYPPGGGEGVSG